MGDPITSEAIMKIKVQLMSDKVVTVLRMEENILRNTTVSST